MTESLSEIEALAIKGALGANLLGGGGTTLPPLFIDDEIDVVPVPAAEAVTGRFEVDDVVRRESFFIPPLSLIILSFTVDADTSPLTGRLTLITTGCKAWRVGLVETDTVTT